MSHAPLCVLCLEPNTTNLVLCATCEEWVKQSRRRAGLPICCFAKVLTDDTYNADD